MGAAEKIPRVSFEQFLLLLEMSQTKLEWLDGIAYAMAGGSFEHSRLANRIGTVLTNALAGKPCVVLQSDMLVKAPADDFAAFPDATVVCGEPTMVTHEKNPALTNPTVIVEVLSSSTEEYDRGEKFERYKRIPSLRDYVLVSQDKNLIEVFSRDRGWERMVATAGGDVLVTSVGVNVEVDELLQSAGWRRQGVMPLYSLQSQSDFGRLHACHRITQLNSCGAPHKMRRHSTPQNVPAAPIPIGEIPMWSGRALPWRRASSERCSEATSCSRRSKRSQSGLSACAHYLGRVVT